MKARDTVLAAFVIIVWGLNFAVIKFGVSEIPPLLLGASRFIFAAFPAIIFVKRPSVSWKYIITYGLTMGVGQFSCLFYAIHIGMPAGVASVVLQAQAFFTILFAGILFKERVKTSQLVGLIVAGLGLVFISGDFGLQHSISIPMDAFLLTLVAAAFWGLSNIVIRQASLEAASQGTQLNMLSMVVWSSLVPPLPMLAASLLLEKSKLVELSFNGIHVSAIFSVLYLAFFATLMGYGLWSMLLAEYPAQKIAPLSLLVPVIGLITAQLALNERLATVQWIGGVIIIIGLMITNFSSLAAKRQRLSGFKSKGEGNGCKRGLDSR